MLSRGAGALLTVNIAVSWETIMRDSGNIELTYVKDFFLCCLFLWHWETHAFVGYGNIKFYEG